MMSIYVILGLASISGIVALRCSHILREYLVQSRGQLEKNHVSSHLTQIKLMGILAIGGELIWILYYGIRSPSDIVIFAGAMLGQLFLTYRLGMRLKGQRLDLTEFLYFAGKIFLGLFLVVIGYRMSFALSSQFYIFLQHSVGLKVNYFFKSLTSLLFLYVMVYVLLPSYLRLIFGARSMVPPEVDNYLKSCFANTGIEPIEVRIADLGWFGKLEMVALGTPLLPFVFKPILLINRDVFSVLNSEEIRALLLRKVSGYEQGHFIKRIIGLLGGLVAASILSGWIYFILHFYLLVKFDLLSLYSSNALGLVFLGIIGSRLIRLQMLQADVFAVLGYGVQAPFLVSAIEKTDPLKGNERGELLYAKVYRQQSGQSVFSISDFFGNLGDGNLGKTLLVFSLLLFVLSGVGQYYVKYSKSASSRHVASFYKVSAPKKKPSKSRLAYY